MKRIIILTVVLTVSANIMFAQNYTEVFDTVFRNISRTQATTGILYERVVGIQLNFISLQKIKYLTHKIEIS